MSKGPDYYNKGKVECIVALKECLSEEAFLGFCKGNVLKYMWRYEDKGGEADLRKALAYINYMLEVLSTQESIPAHEEDFEIVYVTKGKT
tara:strand:- start:63 stop:332 length:270 start_codon:yes stop_codon:yes gene_type:complete